MRVKVPDPYVEVWIRFAQARGVLDRLQDQFFAQMPLSREEYRVLIVLTNVPGETLTQGELAHWLYRRPNTISEQTANMEERGLVQRSRDTQDRRVVHIQPTDRGRSLCSQVTELTHEMVKAVLADMEEGEARELITLLDKVIEGAGRYLDRVSRKPGDES